MPKFILKFFRSPMTSLTLLLALSLVALFWLRDGAVLTGEGGAPIDCDRCPCEGPTSPCCPGSSIPDTLWATVTTNCQTPGGELSVELTRSGNTWSGSAALGTTGRTITILLRCNGSAVEHFEMDDTIDGGCFGGEPGFGYRPPDQSASCDPFELVWTAHTIGGKELCHCDVDNPEIQITITK